MQKCIKDTPDLTLTCFIYFTSEISLMGHTEISIMEWTDRNFCMPHYRNFWHKVDETSQCLEIERCSHKGKCAKQKWNCRHRLNIYARRPLNLNPRSNNISLLLRRKQESRRLYLPSKSIKDTHDLSLPWNWALQPRRQMREAKAESRARRCVRMCTMAVGER